MDANFWESLRLGFMQLRADCAIDPPLKPAGRLTAIWTAVSEPARWRLDFGGQRDGSGVTQRFKWHAQSAAARLGFAGEGDDAVSFWLDQVRKDAPKEYLKVISCADDEGGDRVGMIEIYDICGLSAEYCVKCEADELRIAASGRAPLIGNTSRSVGSRATIAEVAVEPDAQWQDVRARFLKGAQEHPDVAALWEANKALWELYGASQEAARLFTETAQSAVRLLRSSSVLTPGGHATMFGKSFEVWLNLMREYKRGFLWRSRPMSGFRQATRLVESNWLEGVEEPTELARIGGDLSGIPHVFKESADFCEDLAFRYRLFLDEWSAAAREDTSAQRNESANSAAFINLTAEQKDLLHLLVSNHEKTGGAEFFLTRSLTSAGVTYKGGLSIPITHDDSDFKQLQSEGLISFYPVSQGVYRGKPTQVGITIARRGFALFDTESPPEEGQAPVARELGVAKSDLRTDRPSLVDDFLHRCNEESTGAFKVIRKHIWRAVGHAHPRQFQYWQEGSDKATDEDDRNFRRILSMSPAEFLSLLRKKGIAPSSA